MNLHRLPVNIFDCIFVAVLVLGMFRGRRHGMSEELMSLVKWLLIVIGCAFVYQPAGQWLAQSSPFSLLSSYMFVYAGSVLLILAIFGLTRHYLGDKLVGSDVFGKSEYYLGMGAGLVRFGCILIAGLALLNARYFSPTEVKSMEDFQNDVYGSNYFPTWHSAQAVVFDESAAGGWIRDHLSFLLITPTRPEDKQIHQKEAVLP